MVSSKRLKLSFLMSAVFSFHYSLCRSDILF